MRAPLTDGSHALIARARAIAGLTVGELARRLDARVPDRAASAKGFIGGLVERALGASAGSRAMPDFPELGIELKTIPVDATGKPRESTFVCSIALPTIAELDLDDSPLGRKLARVLFVPVEQSLRPLTERHLGIPMLWTPDRDERAVLEADYELLAGVIATGDYGRLSAHLGHALQVRPKAASSRVRRVGPSADGGFELTLPRGFYLRARFTARVLSRLRHAS